MVTRTKKIFVGGLSAPTTLEDVKTYFEQFGPVSKTNCFIVCLNKVLKITTLCTYDQFYGEYLMLYLY